MRNEPFMTRKSSFPSLIVMMPEKFSFELDGLHKAIVDLSDDAGL